jgi:hypothetical protein
MYFKRHTRRKIIIAMGLGLTIGLGLYAYGHPGATLCAIAPSHQPHSTAQKTLLQAARTRIQTTFGPPRSNPIVVFFDRPTAFWPLQPNDYGSTFFVLGKTCLLIGAKGQTPDIVAHELMHAEINDRIGGRRQELPVWFDEGLAMQVDFRPQYDLRLEDRPQAVAIKTSRDFFVSNDKLLTQNYASAKFLVAQWVEHLGSNAVYRELDRIRAGERIPYHLLGERDKP